MELADQHVRAGALGLILGDVIYGGRVAGLLDLEAVTYLARWTSSDSFREVS